MARAIDVLRAHQSEEKSRWKEQAQWHTDNWGWLKHSTQIALAARGRMAALGLTQKELAERMGCSQQYISLILKGKENLTLETVSRLEGVLDTDLLIHPENHVHRYVSSPLSTSHYLNDSDGDCLNSVTKTSELVDGYKRKSRKSRKSSEESLDPSHGTSQQTK